MLAEQAKSTYFVAIQGLSTPGCGRFESFIAIITYIVLLTCDLEFFEPRKGQRARRCCYRHIGTVRGNLPPVNVDFSIFIPTTSNGGGDRSLPKNSPRFSLTLDLRSSISDLARQATSNYTPKTASRAQNKTHENG